MGDRPKLHRLSRAGWVGGAEGVLGDVVVTNEADFRSAMAMRAGGQREAHEGDGDERMSEMHARNIRDAG